MIKSPQDPKFVYLISSIIPQKSPLRKNGLGYTLFDHSLKKDSASFVDSLYIKMLFEQAFVRRFVPNLSSVGHNNGKYEWLITEFPDSLVGKKIYSHLVTYLIDSSGVNHKPVHSNIQIVRDTLLFPLLQIKSSHDGKSLAISGLGDFSSLLNLPSTIICDFDNRTGVADNPILLLSFKDHPKCITTGIEFSPNDSLIYVSTSFDYQVDSYFPKINLDQETAIVKNYLYQINRYTGDKQIVQTFKKKNPYSSYKNLFCINGLQLGGDNKIYFNFSDTNGTYNNCRDMGVIHRPNVVGPSCHIDLKYFHFDEPLSILLPNWARPKNQLSFTSNLFHSPCYDTAEFVAVADSNYKSIIWYFGDGDSLVWKNKEWHASPVVKHTYRNSGTYYVKIRGEKDECEYAMWYGDSLFTTAKLEFVNPRVETEPACGQSKLSFMDSLINTDNVFILWGDGAFTYKDLESDSTYRFQHHTSAKDTLEVAVRIRNQYCQDSINLIVMPQPLPSISSTLYTQDTFRICAGNRLSYIDTLSNLKSRTIDWGSGYQNLNNHDTLSHIFLLSGTYKVMLSDSSIYNCLNTDSFQVIVLPKVMLNPLIKDTFACNGSPITLKAATNYAPDETYHWEDLTRDISLGTNPQIVLNTPGLIQSVVTNFCGTFRDTITLAFDSTYIIQLSSRYNPCQGNMLSLKAGEHILGTRYLWSTNDTSNVLIFKTSGAYWASAINRCGVDTAFLDVQFIEKPIASFANPDVCEGQNIQFQPLQSGGQSFVWRLGDGNISNDSAPVHQYPRTRQARTYLVSLKVSASKDCADSITLPVNVLVSPEASFTHSSKGKTVFFTPNETPTGASYRWTFGDGDSSNLAAPSHTYKADSGTYTVCLTIINTEGCSQTSCKKVYFNVGIQDIDENFTIYPNPTENLLYISSIESFQNALLTLSDAQGKTIMQSNCNGLYCTLNLKSLPKGVYTLSIENEGRVMKKVVIKL
jgi:PKD repeat protein